MTEDRRVLREIAWPEVFPSVLLLSVWKLAINLRALLLAAVGLLATMAAWWAFTQIFGAALDQSSESSQIVSAATSFQAPRDALLPAPDLLGINRISPRAIAETTPIVTAWDFFTRPLRYVFSTRLSFGQALYLLAAGMILLAVWAFIGGAISRLAVVELARGEKLSWGQTLSHARDKWASYFAAPLFPLFGVALAAIPLAIVGLLMKAGSVGVVIGGLLWPLVLLVGLVMAILLVGLLLNWPLMWATISAEGTDSFDALSRSYAYSFQRPLLYFGYLLMAAIVGALLMILVNLFALSVLQLSYWAVSLGSGNATLRTVLGADADPVSPTGLGLMNFWNNGVTLLAGAFVVSYFFSAMSAIYLLLRFHIDATETDEVYLPDDADAYGLPPLKVDSSGVVQVADAPSSMPADNVSPEG